MRDLRRIPLPPTGWTVRACGDAADSVAPFGAIEVPPFTHASIHAVLDRAGIQRPWGGERAELDSEWVGRTEWTFACEVDVLPADAGRHCALAIEAGTARRATRQRRLDAVLLRTQRRVRIRLGLGAPRALRGFLRRAVRLLERGASHGRRRLAALER